MITGSLVRPDLTHKTVEFAGLRRAFLGGLSQTVSPWRSRDGTDYAACSTRRPVTARANPVASSAAAAATGDASFFSDPTAAICGTVIFVGAEGEDIGLDDIRRVKDGIRAVRNCLASRPAGGVRAVARGGPQHGGRSTSVGSPKLSAGTRAGRVPVRLFHPQLFTRDDGCAGTTTGT